MNDQSFNPHENAQNSSYNPQGDAGAQQPYGDPNAQPGGPQPGQSQPGGPHAGQGFGGQQSGPQQPPPPNPEQMAKDQFAHELKQAWEEFERINSTAEEMSKRGDIAQDVISKIKHSANEKLTKKIAEATERYANKTKSFGQGQAHSTFAPGGGGPFAHKLYRSESDKLLAGVCGGLAVYFGVDSTWIRLLFVIVPLIGLLPGIILGAIAYVLFTVILPVKTSTGEYRKMF